MTMHIESKDLAIILGGLRMLAAAIESNARILGNLEDVLTDAGTYDTPMVGDVEELADRLNYPLQWSREDSAAALSEGWDVWRVDANYYDIQRYDDAEIFSDDAQAIAHVYWRASAGSELHRKALAVVLQGANKCPPPKMADRRVGASTATYTLAEIRNGTGWPKGQRFIAIPQGDKA